MKQIDYQEEVRILIEKFQEIDRREKKKPQGTTPEVYREWNLHTHIALQPYKCIFPINAAIFAATIKLQYLSAKTKKPRELPRGQLTN